MAHQFPEVPSQPFVGGRFVAGEDRFDVHCPADGQIIGTIEACGPTLVTEAVRAAQAAFDSGTWSNRPPRERAPVLLRLADLLAERADYLARLDAVCTGRPFRELLPQVSRLPEWYRYFAGIAQGLEGRVYPFAGRYLNYGLRVPLGVVAHIVTWNHPLLLLTKKLAPALAAGNSVVVKPSELAPFSALMLAELAREAGVPAGVLNVVPGIGSSTGAALAGHPGLGKVDFTGGTIAGRLVASAAGGNAVPTTLELGGKTPVIVFEDSPLERSVPGALFSAFIATGQTCVSGARILVQASIAEAFLNSFCEAAAALRLGHPLDRETQMGPVISAAQLERILFYIEEGEREGAKLRLDGRSPRVPPALAKGHFIGPTVFTDVSPDMRIFREEIFGPVVCVVPFRTEDEALTLANIGDYGLGASVWTNSVGRAHRLVDALRAGVIWINDHHRNDPSSPWGGFGSSGYGRENGWESLHSYTTIKSVIVNQSEEPFDWFDLARGAQRYG